MLRLSSLMVYKKQLRRNARSGATELEALDVNKKNRREEIVIPPNGYILKPNEVYIVNVDNPQSPLLKEENFSKDLRFLGIECAVMDTECVLTVQRPIRIYEGMDLFYENKDKT